MAAIDIAKRDDVDRQDWAKRGISGIVAAKNGNQILLQKQRTPSGDIQPVVTVSDKTKFRRYSPDSVKFADAILSNVDDVNIGDQIRARGTRSADGLKVDAEEVVFGTFLTKAGSVVSIDLPSRQVTVKELGTGKNFVIKLTADSNIKQMPAMAAGPRGAAPAGGGPPPAGAVPPGGRGGPPNLSQIVENLPVGKLDDIKPGSAVVVSSTKGAQADQVTAILLVTNADLLIQMATPPGSRGGVLTFGSGGGGAGPGVLNINP